MKLSISTLAVITAITAGAFSAQSARAEGFGSARYTYAPNVWAVEGVRAPKKWEAPHYVQNGMAPHGMLGLSPDMLAKPAPVPQLVPQLPVQTQTAATPTVAQALPKMAAPKYNSSFGHAGSLPTPPAVANNSTPTPQDKAQAGSLKPQAKAAPAKQLVAHHRSSQNVSGKLMKPKSPEGLVADAGKKIDSYGSGYTPGAFLPAAYNGEGSSSSTDLHGKLLTHLRSRK